LSPGLTETVGGAGSRGQGQPGLHSTETLSSKRKKMTSMASMSARPPPGQGTSRVCALRSAMLLRDIATGHGEWHRCGGKAWDPRGQGHGSVAGDRETG
jgi:hypothetical protein